MSYNCSFNRRISVPYSGSTTVSYPKSENGGSITVHYSGTAYEDVEVDIHVDTAPFDSSVASCNSHVNGLTASVSAMNAAQCLAITKNADKVAKTIIDGFFHTVRTDLGTQQVELEQVIESRLILLRKQAVTLQEKQKKMGENYARTTARYQKIFSDLNRELSVRIHEIDQPVFNLVKDVDEQSDRMLHTDMIQTAVTMGKESSLLQAQVSAATVKRHALEAMEQAQSFLISKAMSERTLHETCVNGNGNDSYLIPVCYMKSKTENHLTNQQCVLPEYYVVRNPKLSQYLCERLEDYELDNGDGAQIMSYVQSEMDRMLVDNDKHTLRVRATINKMLNM